MNLLPSIARRPFACRLFATTTTSSASAPSAPPRQSPLHRLHLSHDGRLVPFAGYSLPVQYGRHGIASSHRHCRRGAALFDVSHMQQTRMRGPAAVECFESISTADVREGLRLPGRAALTVLPTAGGGIVDDLIVTRAGGEELFVVSNAGRRAEDRAVMEEAVRRFGAAGKAVSVEFVDSDELALLAVQGPRAARVLERLLPAHTDLSQLWFMQSRLLTVAGVPGCRVTRCGYTGEDGFEISVPADRSIHVAEALLDEPRTEQERAADAEAAVADGLDGADGDGYAGGAVRLAGLGARDTLRLEAGMCLYGADIDERTNPVEAGLAWLVAKRRRQAADFPGAAAILAALKPGGCHRRRVGLRLVASSGPPARHGVAICQPAGGERIGEITSGGPSPSLGGGGIAMGYVAEAFRAPGTRLELEIRGRRYAAEVVRMPFVRTCYHQPPKSG